MGVAGKYFAAMVPTGYSDMYPTGGGTQAFTLLNAYNPILPCSPQLQCVLGQSLTSHQIRFIVPKYITKPIPSNAIIREAFIDVWGYHTGQTPGATDVTINFLQFIDSQGNIRTPNPNSFPQSSTCISASNVLGYAGPYGGSPNPLGYKADQYAPALSGSWWSNPAYSHYSMPYGTTSVPNASWNISQFGNGLTNNPSCILQLSQTNYASTLTATIAYVQFSFTYDLPFMGSSLRHSRLRR